MSLDNRRYETATINYEHVFDGKIFDVRAYNRILTQAEIAAIYNSGTPSMDAGITPHIPRGNPNGLLFHGFAVRTDELSVFTDQNINGLKLIDAQFHTVGTVIGDVTGRAAP